MDVFIEYMVKRKKSVADYIKILATLVLGFVLIFVVSAVTIRYVASLVFLAVAGVIYAMYILITSVNLEYEYILTNNELDVDSIANRRKRKRLTTVNLRQIECRGKISDRSFENYFQNKSIKKIYACEDAKDPETYFIVYYNDDDMNMLFFNPNEKIMKRIEILNPQRGM